MDIMWNPWHGCVKYSEGCKNCYMFQQDAQRNKDGSIIYKNKNSFYLPILKNKNGEYKIPSGETVATCFTSDFFLKDADIWRNEAWEIIRERKDLTFFIITKRVERIKECLPKDWEDGWDNVFINVTCESQSRADERLPIFLELKIKKKGIVVAPILEEITIDKYLKSGQILNVSVGGESGKNARLCNYIWVKKIRNECVKNNVSFTFHQTGSNFLQGREYFALNPKEEREFAKNINIDYIYKKEN